MAENAWNPEDFSALWAAQEDTALRPARPEPANDAVPDRPDREEGSYPNGGGDRTHLTVVDQEVRDGVARLAQAIAVNQVDVVRKGDLEALRVELEGTFTHQLAVALYEVLAASNDRFTVAEDRMTQRITDAIEAHGVRLVTTMEDRELMSMESDEAIRSEMAAMRIRLNGPMDALAVFQRDVRHEVGRLSDIVAGEGAALARRADADAAEFESARGRFEEAAGELGGVTETLGSVKDDVAALREEIAELRQALASGGRRARKEHWWHRSG